MAAGPIKTQIAPVIAKTDLTGITKMSLVLFTDADFTAPTEAQVKTTTGWADLLTVFGNAKPLGVLADDKPVEMDVDVKTGDTRVHGKSTPSRRDITEVTRSLKIKAMSKYSRLVKEYVYGVDLSTATVSADGVVRFAVGSTPNFKPTGIVVVTLDEGAAAGEQVEIHYYPVCRPTSLPSRALVDKSAAVYDLEFSPEDSATQGGTPEFVYFGGDGLTANQTALGWA